MGEWGVEVPANLTWIKIHSFISSARKGIVGNSYKLLHYLKLVRRLRKQSFFAGLTDTSTEKFRPKDVKEFI